MEPPKDVSPVGRTVPVVPIGQARQPRRAEPEESSDRVSLSPEAQRMMALRRRIAESPDVREDLVASLRRAIAEGRYRPASEVIAQRLVAALRRAQP
ncbi:MAG: flagellar biosynthesis anti-sigma factor FlgM [Firmicutes bacterium]|uniref:Negative regulator of flagellin synthesis n=1 Tax=Geochorda subterranea TaxID=3109564 RepID=A0ABZ1BME2_9FIRM|nr:flagellar biosynthesis anti-sigma factor FlgM [Limnochorda sp. LNt]NLG69714.1 flagellar biosynthesis anti-sigma factor FlgM [Bacillota bacterium]WRP13989.1 flagellar biosynthesis anti-sigma factor FlgM [Limnochorda sp. LNt]